MIVIYGEVLVDLIKQSDNSFEYYLGGAPFNVAYCASVITEQVKFVGNVGDDILGEFIKEEVSKTKVISNIYTDKLHNTTLAFISNDKNGERHFSFARKNTADYHFNKQSLEMIKDATLVHLGTLMLSESIGYQFALDVIDEAKKHHKPISIDINYRDDIFESKKSAIDIYESIISKCDIIKLSLDELEMFAGTTDIYECLEKIVKPSQKVFITLGSQGSALYINKKLITSSTINVTPVDTTGAGDAFFGTILGLIDHVGYEQFFEDEKQIKHYLRLANAQGAIATTKKGALSAIVDEPTLKTLI